MIILGEMSAKYTHTCIRARDIDKSVGFYEQLGFEHRGRLNFESAYNVYLGLPSDGEEYRICFVADPDGYRIELIDGAFPTPQDPPHPSTAG